MKPLTIAKICVILSLISCQSVPIQESVVNQLITEAKEIYKDDPRLLSTLNACSVTISDQNKTIIELQEEIERYKTKIDNLQIELQEASRDAGYKDMMQFLFSVFLAIAGFALLGAILYLIAKGKIRLPGLIG